MTTRTTNADIEALRPECERAKGRVLEAAARVVSREGEAISSQSTITLQSKIRMPLMPLTKLTFL
jgi:hypothetical protein